MAARPTAYELFGASMKLSKSIYYEVNLAELSPKKREDWALVARSCLVVSPSSTVIGLVEDAYAEDGKVKLAFMMLDRVPKEIAAYIKKGEEKDRPTLAATEDRDGLPLHFVLGLSGTGSSATPPTYRYAKASVPLPPTALSRELYDFATKRPAALERLPIFTTAPDASGKDCIIGTVGYAYDLDVDQKNGVVSANFNLVATNPETLGVRAMRHTLRTRAKGRAESTDEAYLLFFSVRDRTHAQAPAWARPLTEPLERDVSVRA
jgi:hypothetical protein